MSKLSDNERRNINRATTFGYPQCCIASFVERSRVPVNILVEMNKIDTRKLDGTGYVPCALCNESKSEVELIEVITLNRTHHKPFPNE